MASHEVSQRAAARAVLEGNEVLWEEKVYKAIMKRFNMSERQAKQGVKNSIHSDATILRSTFDGRVYLRLATTLCPKAHLDFGTSEVIHGMTREQHAEWMARRDAPKAAPWDVPGAAKAEIKLEAHILEMQAMGARYVHPDVYVDREGNRSDAGGRGLESAQHAWLFAQDMLYMLDGPEQRAAQMAAE